MRNEDLVSALQNASLEDQLSRRQPAFFLDYDGTLTPIVAHPEDAVIGESMRTAVKDLSEVCTVAVVSGRDRKDVQQLVGLDELVYAGSHGFDISGPGGMQMQNEEGKRFLPLLDQAEQELRGKLSPLRGVQVERKKFSIAVHYRNAQEDLVRDVQRAVDEVHSRHATLRKSSGKKVIELQPGIDWDKGRAVLWLLDHLGLRGEGVLPVYIGDDLTDEDAFGALRESGVGILVGDHGHETKARYRLRGVPEVEEFLRGVIRIKRS